MNYKVLVETNQKTSLMRLTHSEKVDISMNNKALLKAFQEHEQFKGIPIVNIANARTNHPCQYCGRITKGNYKDLLCDECKEIFGHSLYSEL